MTKLSPRVESAKEKIIDALNRTKTEKFEFEITQKEIKVLEYRYGIIDGVAHSLEQCGQEFGVTRERIRQIEAKALDKLGLYECLFD